MEYIKSLKEGSLQNSQNIVTGHISQKHVNPEKKIGWLFFLLQNDKSKEVIACAETARHFRPDNAEYSGNTVFIEEIAENPKYKPEAML